LRLLFGLGSITSPAAVSRDGARYD
jgi:hypothetical protein